MVEVAAGPPDKGDGPPSMGRLRIRDAYDRRGAARPMATADAGLATIAASLWRYLALPRSASEMPSKLVMSSSSPRMLGLESDEGDEDDDEEDEEEDAVVEGRTGGVMAT